MVYALGNTMKKITPANPNVIPLMGIMGLITNIANYVLLVLCLFFADHWWYALIMWVFGFVLSILVPPTRLETILGYIGVACAPACTLIAYLNLFF